ncbi:MAG TPA: universal stress protein [Streptomyces sp.]|mgnify:CR=1 FL=1|nr:universal stress protein [Streptomyces sp. SM18]HBF85772.1 universal stress protein [Streptomyces sp.]
MNQWPPHIHPSGEHPPHQPGATPAPGTARPDGHDPCFRHGVVVGYTGSPTSERALAYACGMAGRTGAGLIIVHVSHTWPLADWWHGGEALMAPDMPDIGNDVLTAALTHSGEMSQSPRATIHASGDVCLELDEIGRHYAADAIVVGASRGIAARLFGCVGSRLTVHPRRPVIVVP